MKTSQSSDWREARDIEDLLALIQDIDELRLLIKRQAWQLGNAEIFQASEEQKKTVEKIKAKLSQKWRELAEEIEDDE